MARHIQVNRDWCPVIVPLVGPAQHFCRVIRNTHLWIRSLQPYIKDRRQQGINTRKHYRRKVSGHPETLFSAR